MRFVCVPRRLALRKKYGFNGPALLYAGRLAPEKHVDVILKALSRLVDRFPLLTFVATGHGIATGSATITASYTNASDVYTATMMVRVSSSAGGSAPAY